ncbi:MAG: phenylalanine--tRNA ligase subunit beta [Gammaproteobacteria bacterium]|nr:phenylalanine--tRNA ligase subunit beta [Gammaproteobacteria bacterium]
MKVSYQWLKEFVVLEESPQQIADRLSLAGLEVAAVEAAVPPLEDIVIGEVLSVEKHPDADKLNVTKVSVGDGAEHQVVCGAPNVRAGMKAPVILPGARLPDGTKIKKAKLRGVESHGMLCSARELGLSEDHTGLMDLPSDAPLGKGLADYLGGEDSIIEIEITPNRGDCLGMIGVARDVSALVQKPVQLSEVGAVKADITDAIDVDVKAPEACPVFLGRVIKGIDTTAETPLWMQERLRRAGIRPISPAVDVTQYVMLEYGQPMHGYDLREIRGGIVVRFAKDGEKLTLLDGSEAKLDKDMLVIATGENGGERLLGVAGIMGGEGSGVQDDTANIYLECAYFDNSTINGRPRRLGLHTDAGYRFERGVDPAGQRRAIERATQLLQEIAGGQVGPVVETVSESNAPARNEILLRREKLDKLLGISIPTEDVERILTNLGMAPTTVDQGWQVTAPSWRFDIEIEEDLVEEVGRIYGYDHIPPAQYPSTQPMEPVPEAEVALRRLRDVLVQRGYQEAVTYSFVDEKLQRELTGDSGIPLANPITNDMTHMRLNLWAGLLGALQHNLNRQQHRVRLFETGLRFIPQGDEIIQENVVSGLVSGDTFPLQWGTAAREVDFADLKGDVEALVGMGGGELRAERAEHPALHPGQSAKLLLDGEELGWIGRIHPKIVKFLDLPQSALVFELKLDPLRASRVPENQAISRFPAIRRDLALLVGEETPAQALVDTVQAAAGEMLQDVTIFDVYRGKGVDSGLKSVALSLILQDSSRTLTEDDIEAVMARVASQLREDLGAQLRD